MSPIYTVGQIIAANEVLRRAVETALAYLEADSSMLDKICSAKEILSDSIEAAERVLGGQEPFPKEST